MNQVRLVTGRGPVTLAFLWLLMALVVTACSGATAASNGPISTSAPVANTAPAGKPAPQATPAPQAQNPNGNIDCTAIGQANQDFGTTMPKLINFTPDTDYSAYTDPSSPFYVDFVKTRKDLDSLTLLPDPTNAVELTFGKPSESVAYFRQMVDVAESDIKNKGKPFHDTGTSGQKVIGLDTPWGKEYASFGLALEKACPNFQLPADTPASIQATHQVGETATLGDLRVTLDKVTTVPGELGNLPDSGSRFVFVNVTIENTGQTTLATNSVTQASLKDAAGKQYGLEPHAIMLSASRPLNGELAAGEKTAGTIGYQLPTNAGDLIWIVEDNAPHRAVFAIKASEIVAEGAPIGESTAAAMQTSVAATTAALIEMSNNADATAAAQTANPGTPEPTETPEPTDTPEPTETPSP